MGNVVDLRDHVHYLETRVETNRRDFKHHERNSQKAIDGLTASVKDLTKAVEQATGAKRIVAWFIGLFAVTAVSGVMWVINTTHENEARLERLEARSGVPAQPRNDDMVNAKLDILLDRTITQDDRIKRLEKKRR